MHVAVDARDLATDWRGISRYLRAVLGRLIPRDDARWTLLVAGLFVERQRAALAAILGTERFALARRVPTGADVVWHPWNGTFFRAHAPAVATLHDAVPFAWPHPDARRREHQQAPFVRSAQSATLVLANSQFTASEATRWLAVDPARIRVTLLGVEPVFTPDGPRTANARPYLLYAGAIEPRKNVATLLQAFADAFPGGDVELVVAGSRPPELPNVRYAGALDRDALLPLYRGALAVAVPSLYEGFGFPVLEAMACGTPVIRATGSSLDEVGGDACLTIAEPQSSAAWVAPLQRLARDGALRAELRARGLVQARRFDWDTCAAQTLAALREAAS